MIKLQTIECCYSYLPANNVNHASFQCHALVKKSPLLAVNVLGKKKMIRQMDHF